MNRLAAANSLKRCVLRKFASKFFCNANDKRALSGLCLILISHLCQIRDPWHSQAFTTAHIVVGLFLHIHSFIHKVSVSHIAVYFAIHETKMPTTWKSYINKNMKYTFPVGEYTCIYLFLFL